MRSLSRPIFFSLLFLFSANDTLIFGEAKLEKCLSFLLSILSLEAASRIKINLVKFKLVLVGIIDDVEGLAHIFGYRYLLYL